jgi:hypothetical protein
MTVERRSFLASLGATVAGSALFKNTTQEDDNSFTITGEKEVSVTWKPPDHFDGNAIAHALRNDNVIHLNEAWEKHVSNYVILHELGHCLGYGHIDGTVMNKYLASTGDMGQGVSVSDVTSDIVSSFDGFRLVDLGDTSDILTLVDEWSDGRMRTPQILYTLDKWRDDSCQKAYYTTSWDGFGGYFTGPREYNHDAPVHQCHGYYYGMPSVSLESVKDPIKIDDVDE